MTISKSLKRKIQKQMLKGFSFPSAAEQDAIIESLKNATAESLIEKMRDVDYRHMLNEVFNSWRLRMQIRVLRQQRRWTQDELAIRAHLHQSVISKLENIYAPVDVSIKTLLRIAHAFDVCLIVRFDDWASLVKDILSTVGNPAEALKIGTFSEWLADIEASIE